MDEMKKTIKESIILSVILGNVFNNLFFNTVYADNQTINITTQEDYKSYELDGDIFLKLEGNNNELSITDIEDECEDMDNWENRIISAGDDSDNSIEINNTQLKYVTINGAMTDSKNASGNTVKISGENTELYVAYGAQINQYKKGQNNYDALVAENNQVIVNNVGEIWGTIAGAEVWYGEAVNNYVLIQNSKFSGKAELRHDNRYTSGIVWYGAANNNKIEVEKSYLHGNYSGAFVGCGNATHNIINIKDCKSDDGAVVVGAFLTTDVLNDDVGKLEPTLEGPMMAENNTVNVYGENEQVNGYGYNDDFSIIGAWVTNNQEDILTTSKNNSVNIYGSVNCAAILGSFAVYSNSVNNKVTLYDGSEVTGVIVGSYNVLNDKNRNVSGNSVNLQGRADVSGADLWGYYVELDGVAEENIKISNNNLVIDKGWTGEAQSVQNFNNINFNNIVWQPDNDKAILTTDKGSIKDTNINLTLQNGQKVNVGESMLLFASNNDLGDIANDGNTFNTTLGVATAVEGIVEQSADNKTVTATIKDVKLADQTKLVAKNRAVAAAFINQGTDLIADSLDVLSRDGKYGVKTFAAVHGNRSKYDVNSDLKINGWSTIVGVGSETEHHGGDFSWGVFYENGSGNYRTFNSFNNEFFRGDGSLVYNGGGIAARYENAHGVYTEGSLRAGMLKSEMTDALSDGENKYGYKSESEYYGAHIGIGQIIPLTESSDLDVYGKFFHTYTEGDSFNVAGDEFEFDGINSDRLRVGARLTTNKENKFSTYYGLAYEYEFNGDAEMRAAGMNAPTQSLQGSSCMAEIGFNYQPTPDSPWSFDLNMRGYAGQREGATFNVQATYTF